MEIVKLTQYSHGAGCGCKIAPNVLTKILKSNLEITENKQLIVGNKTHDDAAVYNLGNGTAVISTTDFFMPIVDDAFSFGQIAAANAISDIYAMGGKPIMAVAILGWPIDKLLPELAQVVLEGGRSKCQEAGIPLAGGHSIDSPEPIFGLAVTGTIDIDKLKRNDTATEGCKLYLTKPLGVGILTTAQKRGILKNDDEYLAPESMSILNSIGAELAEIKGVKSMTDVTGFGLIGHLTEMCEGSNLSAKIEFNKIPKFTILEKYIEQKSYPGGTLTNWKSYGKNVLLKNESYKTIVCDPQTSGGLLIAVEPNATKQVEQLLKKNNLYATSFGKMVKKQNVLIEVV
ncbi:MAG: selenide, water dikinase SelD [Chlorobi bacterium]|nr:selenide, water dikinase SelD [Chlorobiota bacterium]